MGHEIEIDANGKASALYVGQPAWHGLGVVLDEPPTIEEALRLSGLDWHVKLEPLCLQGDGRLVTSRATVRETDGAILGVVGPDFVPLQNAAAFAWFQPFLETKAATIEAAGSLRGGKRVWVLAKIQDNTLEVVPGDPVEQHVLLAHGHDGSLAIRVGFTATRIVCANTLSSALSDSKAAQLLRVRHTAHATIALEEIREIMDLARREFTGTIDQLRVLARVGCDEATLRTYVRIVFAGPDKANDEKAAPRLVKEIVPLFDEAPGSRLGHGTLWTAYNALTYYVTHARGKNADVRVDNLWFGEGARILDRALETGLALARGNGEIVPVLDEAEEGRFEEAEGGIE